MARIRSIKPEFWDDDAVGALSRDARLLFVACWTFADDEGLLRWSASYLRASAFMYDADVTEGRIREWMNEIERLGFVFTYATGRTRQRIGYIVQFRKHQRIDKPQPGRLPPPPWSDPAVVLMYARRDGFQCHLCGEPVNEELEPRSAADPYDPASPADRTGRNPSPDHVIPRSKGGSDYPTNIRTAHVSCNKGRGNRAPSKSQVSGSSSNAVKSVPRTVPGTVPEESASHSPPDLEGKGSRGDKEGIGDATAGAVNSNVEGIRLSVQLPSGQWLNGSGQELPAAMPAEEAERKRQMDALMREYPEVAQ